MKSDKETSKARERKEKVIKMTFPSLSLILRSSMISAA